MARLKSPKGHLFITLQLHKHIEIQIITSFLVQTFHNHLDIAYTV